MHELLPLVNGGYALVDEEDMPRLSVHRWWVQYRYLRGERKGPSAVVTKLPDGTKALMHRMVLDAPPGMIVDHVNGVPLNNTKANLRACTLAQNAQNSRRRSHNKSGVKGVYLDSESFGKSPRWRAQITVDGVRKRLGRFRSKSEAERAYREAAAKLHGAFARLA